MQGLVEAVQTFRTRLWCNGKGLLLNLAQVSGAQGFAMNVAWAGMSAARSSRRPDVMPISISRQRSATIAACSKPRRFGSSMSMNKRVTSLAVS